RIAAHALGPRPPLVLWLCVVRRRFRRFRLPAAVERNPGFSFLVHFILTSGWLNGWGCASFDFSTISMPMSGKSIWSNEPEDLVGRMIAFIMGLKAHLCK